MKEERQEDNYQTKRQDARLGNIILMAILIIGSAVIGFFTGNSIGYFGDKYGIPGLLISIGLLILIFLGASFLHILVHEGGHLVFGLLSGYKFVSFRVGSLMFIKESGKLKTKKFNIVGTGGQCLMMPDSNWNAYKFPYILYNLGGSLANVILALISLALYMAFPETRFISELFIISFIVGIMGALMNAIPMKISGIANDGYNALHLSKDSQALRALYLQLYINGLQTKGIRLKDIPEEYFEIPEAADLSNPLIVTIGVFKCNRLHDNKDFIKAKEYSQYLIDKAPGLLDLHKNELLCELLFYEIIGTCRKDEIERIYTKELKDYIKNTSAYVSRRRLMYAYEIFVNNDRQRAKEELEAFNKIAKNYPYSGDVESEREIIKFIDDLAIIKNIN